MSLLFLWTAKFMNCLGNFHWTISQPSLMKRTWLQIHHRASRATQTQSLFFAYFLWKCHNPPTEAEIDPTQLSFWVASSRILMCVCKVVVNLLVMPLCSRLLYAEGVLVQSTEETALWPLLLFQHQHFPCFRVLLASTNNQWVKTHPCGRGERDT